MSRSIDHPECPVRQYMDDPNITWKHGKPNFERVDRLYVNTKKMSHPADSIEKLVENLVKTWEMESSHKIVPSQWKTVDHDKFRITVNGGRKLTLDDNIRMGNYLMFLEQSPLYDKRGVTNDQSQDTFRQCFPGGFAFELVELISGPPNVTFTWRHWATYEGNYYENKPTGEHMELFGCAKVKVNKELKVLSLDIFYDPSSFINKLNHGRCIFAQTIPRM